MKRCRLPLRVLSVAMAGLALFVGGNAGMCLSAQAAGAAPGNGKSEEQRLHEEGIAKVLKAMPADTRHVFVMMPMRDGVRLATDIFSPAGGGAWPVVLLRTPYARWDERIYEAMRGEPCVTVLQNLRGRYGSEGAGTFPRESFDNEIDDSYDAVEWIARQEWCNGKVGMWGPSGHGVAATAALWSGAPHLTVVDTNITGDNAYLYWIYSNGARRIFYSWLSSRGVRVSDWPRPTTSPFDVQAHHDFVAERAAQAHAAYRDKAGWFDLFSEAALDHFAALAHTGKAYVSVSPGGHGPIGGDLKFPNPRKPAEAIQASRGLYEWLTQDPPAAESKSYLVYFLMGDCKDPAAPGNICMVSRVWPVAHTPTPYYLQKDGTLALTSPGDNDAFLPYVYDPHNPVPSLGGNYQIGQKSGPHDQRPLKDRKDILRFATDPLEEPVGVTGKIWLELYFSSDVRDTCFTAKLVDVYPDGYEAVIRESAMLARYWQGLDKPAPLEKGQVYRIRMDCWSTALVFNKGHHIAVHISSSSDPAYEVHPNSYEPVSSEKEYRVAHNAVHVSANHPSRIILPVIPKESYLSASRGD